MFFIYGTGQRGHKDLSGTLGLIGDCFLTPVHLLSLKLPGIISSLFRVKSTVPDSKWAQPALEEVQVVSERWALYQPQSSSPSGYRGSHWRGAPRNHHVEQGSHEESGSYIRLHHDNFLSLRQSEFWTGSPGWQ